MSQCHHHRNHGREGPRQCICTEGGSVRILHPWRTWERARGQSAFCRCGLPICQQDFHRAWHHFGKLHHKYWLSWCQGGTTSSALPWIKIDPWKRRSQCPPSVAVQSESAARHIQESSWLLLWGCGNDQPAHRGWALPNLRKLQFPFQLVQPFPHRPLLVLQLRKEFWQSDCCYTSCSAQRNQCTFPRSGAQQLVCPILWHCWVWWREGPQRDFQDGLSHLSAVQQAHLIFLLSQISGKADVDL